MHPVPPARHLLRAKDLADARYLEPLTVDDLARAARLSPAHFSREFRREFGESPHRYLLTRRLERAAALLRTTDWSWRGSASPWGCRASDRSRPASDGCTTCRRPATAPGSRHRPRSRSCRRASCASTTARNTARFEKTGPGRVLTIDPIESDRPTMRGADHEDRQRPAVGERPGRSRRVLHEEARHGGARRRDAAGDGRLPLAHRRPRRPARHRHRADARARPADASTPRPRPRCAS